MRDIHLLVLALLTTLLLWVGFLALAYPPVDDTDSGVGCVDDCLELIQDEADTQLSKGRN
jgi:hypothetical protein